MIYPIIFGAAVCILLVLNVILEKRKTAYEIRLFIRNGAGEFFLVYDNRSARFTAPCRSVRFNEIPTKTVHTLMKELAPDQAWEFDWEYHWSDHKYDRVRDDIGPAHIYDTAGRIGKTSVLCYVLRLERFEADYDLKKEYPYPEFYSMEEIDAMSEDIRPSEPELTLLRELSGDGQKESCPCC